MSDCCKELFQTLDKYEEENPVFCRDDVFTVATFILTWQQRQCKCVFRDARYHLGLKKQIENLLNVAISNIPRHSNGGVEVLAGDSPGESSSHDEESETLSLKETEKILLAVSKIFQLNFPFYQAQKSQNVQQDGDIPELLLHNVVLFCDKGGLVAIKECFQHADPDNLPFAIAHVLINIVAQLRIWFHVPAIVQYIMPLRGPVIRYLCKLTEKELKLPDGRAMADLMWSTVKGPVESGPVFDRDSMDLAFKYFTSSTLTVRLAGLNQITNQVHVFLEMIHTECVGEIDSMCLELAQWLVDNKIVEHIFGPNLHVELVKQSQVILNFLAQETKLTTQHIDCIWTAAQLKHASRYVHELLTSLTKHMDMQSIHYLLDLVSKLPPSAHTRQTLYLASLLVRMMWGARLSSVVINSTSAPSNSPLQTGISANTAAAVIAAAANRSKFESHGSSLSQSSSRSGSLSDLSYQEEQRDNEHNQATQFNTNVEGMVEDSAAEPVDESNFNKEQDEFPSEQDGVYASEEKNLDNNDIESVSCTNTHPSSLSDRDLEDFEGEDIDEDFTPIKEAAVAFQNMQREEESNKDPSLDIDNVCKDGNTLLWDLVQDGNACLLDEGVLQEAEKLLCQLICYAGERKIRMKFIEGCLNNVAQSRSVEMSLRLLPRLFSSFHQYRNNYGTGWVIDWANKELKMMELFFENLVQFSKNPVPDNSLYTIKECVQARLQFLSSVFCNDLSPNAFRLSVAQVDILWDCLVINPSCADVALEWFVQQTQSPDFHALETDTLQFVFVEKLSSLRSENMSMLGLQLFQLLFAQFRRLDDCADLKAKGLDLLWKIALRAKSTEVSQAAINQINSIYINVDKETTENEKEFVQRCMKSIQEAARDLDSNTEPCLQVMERGLSLLKSHIKAFKRRFAFHLRTWTLEGHGVTSHQSKPRNSEKFYPIRVLCQPAGLTDKGTFEMYSTDLVADLRAEITIWCLKLEDRRQHQLQAQKELSDILQTSSSQPLPNIPGYPPSLVPPFRLISTGHELTPDLDEKSLAEVGLKDLQLVFVSSGAPRKDRHIETGLPPASQLPPPPWEALPMVILLQKQHFEELFSLLEQLTTVGRQFKEEHDKKEKEKSESAQEIEISGDSSSASDVEEGKVSLSDAKLNVVPRKRTMSVAGHDFWNQEDVGCPVHKHKGIKLLKDVDFVRSEGQSMFAQMPLEVRIQSLSHLIWDLIMLLPSNLALYRLFENMGSDQLFTGNKKHEQDSSSAKKQKKKPSSSDLIKKGSEDSKDFIKPVDQSSRWKQFLDTKHPHRLLYSLQVIDLIAKRSANIGKDADSKSSSSDSHTSSDSDMSDNEEEETRSRKSTDSNHSWTQQFINLGGLKHLVDIFQGGSLQRKGNTEWTGWNQECLACVLKLLFEFGVFKCEDDELDDEVFDMLKEEGTRLRTTDGEFRVRYNSSEKEETIMIRPLSLKMISLLDLHQYLDKILQVTQEATILPARHSHRPTMCRAEVVHYAMWFLTSWSHTDSRLAKAFTGHSNFKPWLEKTILSAPEPVVRLECCRGIYRLSLHLIKENGGLTSLIQSLMSFLPVASSFKPKDAFYPQSKPLGPSCREFFWLLCRLVDSLPDSVVEENLEIDCNSLSQDLGKRILSHDKEKGHSSAREDESLTGMLKLCTAIMRHNPPFKFSPEGKAFMNDIFHICLFELPLSMKLKHNQPKCKSKASRNAAFDLLIELTQGSLENLYQLQTLLLEHHTPDVITNQHKSYGWHYWPSDNGRAQSGLVGIINLGATCYMASCLQQLYMIPEARSAILRAKPINEVKYDLILKELQRMFCFLQDSERKAYNPKSFCKAYTMEKQPLNTGEQKDMTEFFIDLISKLEDMSPDLRGVVKELFCGEITNNVVSLDCNHVSKTKEDFYSVRCTVADMKNLYESLDEVTVKDMLEGDNMYTCSQCGKKVRAEKRACFKVLPRILCFNTMRYTFNMVTMMKEKVNTHFSFPEHLNMASYSEEYLMGDKKDDPVKENWYSLIGVVVHTGTAEGGHYYSFIRDRTAKQDRWFLFNDAEVKPFDPAQIAAECFGGEMTTKTYDAVTERFLDFSFEKTHSAYMLFYEQCQPETQMTLPPHPSDVSEDMSQWIWQDNMNFLHDRFIFDPAYFSFMWNLCGNVFRSIPESSSISLSNIRLGTSFLLETLVHAKEKPLLKNWLELLISQFEQNPGACEWFLDMMAVDNWWPVQILIKCPVQGIRQMFVRLCLQVIHIIHPTQVDLYKQPADDDEEDECTDSEPMETGSQSPITRFVKAVLMLLEGNIKTHTKNLSELFHFINQFAAIGEEERQFLLDIDAITIMVNFYLGTKIPENNETLMDEDEELEDDDDVLPLIPDDRYRSTSLEKMISVIAVLVQEARGDRKFLQLSENDTNALMAGKLQFGIGFPFLFQAIKDNINLRHTANLIFGLSRYNQKHAENIVSMLMLSIQKLNSEQSQPFFKLLSMLTEMNVGTPGSPNFTNLTLSRIWEAAEHNAALCIDWLTCLVPKNKIAHQWVLDNMDLWVEKFLIADNSVRIRSASAYLLVALIPNNHFRQGFRSRSLALPQKELQLSAEAVSVLHKVYKVLLSFLPKCKNYCDRSAHGTTKLVSFFAVLNYCLVSDREKEMFTPYCFDLWKLFHPLMSEPSIPVHHNKQALLTFWYHVCQDCEDNVSFITESTHVASNIAFNYILSNDDPEVVNFNRSVLPAYYGILRLCCEHSRTFTRQLASHSNMKWAFENLTPNISQYPQVVEELFHLMQLFASAPVPEEAGPAATFRRNTLILYMNCLDGGAAWTTLINAFRILLQTEEDRLTVITNQGLLMLSDAFATLHMMYHEATACHVTGDLTEILTVLYNILTCCRQHFDRQDVRSSVVGWSERMEIAQKLLSVLNSYTPKEVRKCCLDVLNMMVLLYSEECVEILIPFIYNSHQRVFRTNPSAPPGPYFPRRQGGVILGGKAIQRPHNPELNMCLNPQSLEAPKGADESYDNALLEYYMPYQQFLDKLLRFGFNQDQVSETTIKLSCQLAMEGVPLHLVFFCKLWLEIYQKSSENSKYKQCIEQLCQQQEFNEYIELLLLDERTSLNINQVYSFMCWFFPRFTKSSPVLGKQWPSLVQTLVTTVIADKSTAENSTEAELKQLARRLTAELRALSLLFSVSPPQKADISDMLLPSLEKLLQICKQYQKQRQEKLKLVEKTEESSNQNEERPPINQTESHQKQEPEEKVQEKIPQSEPLPKKRRKSSEDISSMDVTTKDVPSEDVPSEDAPSKNVPSDDVPSKNVSSKDFASEDSECFYSDDVPSKDLTSENIPSKDISSEDVPSTDFQSADVLSEDDPSEDIPSENIPSEGGQPSPSKRSRTDKCAENVLEEKPSHEENSESKEENTESKEQNAESEMERTESKQTVLEKGSEKSKAETSSGSTRKRFHSQSSVFIPKMSVDWIDTLAKTIESIISKLPK